MLFELLENNIVTIVILCGLFFLTWIFVRPQRPLGIPPGPIPLPVVGNVLVLRGDLRRAFRKLRGQYGDVFSVYMGNKLAIVLNGHDTIKEAFVKNGDVFSDRIDRILFLPKYQKAIGILRASGDVWRRNRRFALSTLRDFGMGKNILQTKIQEEVVFLIEAIERQKSEAFDLKPLIQNAVSNIICSIVFGKRFDYDDVSFRRYLQNLSTVVSPSFITLFLGLSPLGKLPGDLTKIKQFAKDLDDVLDFVRDIISENLKFYDESNIRSIIDAYIKQEKLDAKTLTSEDICDLELLRIIYDLFAAGTETTSTALLWGFLYFLHYPDIQEKAHAQVSDAVETGRFPGMEDRVRMPYLEATIMELLRHADIAPFGVPHAAHEDTHFRGYFIPKGTMLFPNIDSVMTDEDLWTRPEEFNPDRFLDAESLKKVDYFIPFGIGKRACLGESLARMELSIFLAALAKHFKFLAPEGEDPQSLEGRLGVTFSPNNYMIRAVKRA